MTPEDRKWTILFAIEEVAAGYGYTQIPAVVILAQSALETADFSSGLIVNSNNAFGMQLPTSRTTTAIDFVIAEGGKKFCVYASLRDSVIDYFLRQKAWHIPDTMDVLGYMEATKASGYFTDPSYIAKWEDKLYDLQANMGTPPDMSDPPPVYGPPVPPGYTPPNVDPPPSPSRSSPVTALAILALAWLVMR